MNIIETDVSGNCHSQQENPPGFPTPGVYCHHLNAFVESQPVAVGCAKGVLTP